MSYENDSRPGCDVVSSPGRVFSDYRALARSIFHFTVPLAVIRIYAMISLYRENLSLEILPVVSRGFVSDFVVGAAAGLGFHILLRKRLFILYFFSWALWVLALTFNIEHIKVNFSNMNFAFASLAFTREFLGGSVLTVKNLYTFLATVAVSIPFFLIRLKRPSRAGRAVTAVASGAVAVCISIVVFVPASRSYPYWVQMNVFEENTRAWLFNPKAPHSDVDISDEVRKEFFSWDLAGKPATVYPAEKPNVLIVLVEGLGYETLTPKLMPATRQLARRNIFYSNFINVQRQTNRGLYALICGDYPNFLGIEAKPDFVAMYGPPRPCLPELLRRSGYRTVFMQSANLGYMQKGLFAGKVGFEESFGENSYEAEGKANDWGVDDLTLYEYAFRKIQELEGEGKPWFLTLLTSGTHHPYNVPGMGNPTHRQAVRYADASLMEFLGNLRESGILEKTLILITCDEASSSRGEGLARELSINHAPLIVLAPHVSKPGVRGEPFMQSDILLSIVDFAGLEPGPALGRSIFRSYESGRNLIFGNIYSRKVYSYDARGYVYVCSAELDCSAYLARDGGIMGSSYEPAEPESEYVEKVREALLYNELNSYRLDTEYVFHMENKPYTGFNFIVGDHKFSAAPGERVMWTAQILAQDDIKVFAVASIPVDGNVLDRAGIFKVDEFVPAGKSFSIHKAIDVESEIPEIWTMVFVDTGTTGKYVVEDLAIRRIRRK